MPHSAGRRAALSRVLVPLLALALPACDSTSGPGGVEGSYRVHSVNGRPPPMPVRGTSSGGVVQVVDARLQLAAPDQLTVELETRVVEADGTTGAPTRTTYAGTYQANGDVLAIGPLTGGDARAQAEGVVISPREVAVTLHIPAASFQGFYVYPVALILRR